MNEGAVVVYHAAGENRAQLIKSFLAAHGIPAHLRGEAVRKTHGLTLDGLGDVAILVSSELAPRARDLLDRVERGELELDGDVPRVDPGGTAIDPDVPASDGGAPAVVEGPSVSERGEPERDDGSTRDPEGTVAVYHAPGEGPAQLIKSFLAAHDIPCHLRGEALRKTHGFTLDGLGNVAIMVLRTHESQARDLLQRMERGELAIDEDTPLD